MQTNVNVHLSGKEKLAIHPFARVIATNADFVNHQIFVSVHLNTRALIALNVLIIHGRMEWIVFYAQVVLTELAIKQMANVNVRRIIGVAHCAMSVVISFMGRIVYQRLEFCKYYQSLSR